MAFAVGGRPPRPPRPCASHPNAAAALGAPVSHPNAAAALGAPAWTNGDPDSQSSVSASAANTGRDVITLYAPTLIHRFAGPRAPGLSVGGARDLDQPRAIAVGAARRVGHHFDRIADLEGVLVDALLLELGRPRALEHPALHRRVGGRAFDVQERVRRAQLYLHHLACDRD